MYRSFGCLPVESEGVGKSVWKRLALWSSRGIYWNEMAKKGCCEALRAIRGREGCSLNRMLKCFDVLSLLIILVLQGSILNYYLIERMEGSGTGWYFWFLADFCVLIVMMTAVFLSRRHYSNVSQNAEGTDQMESRSVLGLFPLSYISWFLYSSQLTAKIVLLFRMDIATNLKSEDWYGPQFLAIVIGCAAVVFLLLVDCHHEAAVESNQATFITFLTAYTTIEILDSVTFLGLLFPSETGLIIPYKLEDTVLALTCLNFLLPTLALYKLSQCEFGANTGPLGIKLIYRVLHITLINAPYLGIRMYLWTYFNHEVSVFVLKNFILCYIHIRSFVPECREWIRKVKKLRRTLLNDERPFDGLPSSARKSDPSSIELRERQTEQL